MSARLVREPAQRHTARDVCPWPAAERAPTVEARHDLEVDCPEGTSWGYSQTGTAWLSLLGRVRFEITHCTVAPEGRFGPGTTVFTAPNGDELWMEQWGTFTLDSPQNPTRSDGVLNWRITGGTGRFTGASGSGKGTVTTTITGPATGSTSGTWTGKIGYNGTS